MKYRLSTALLLVTVVAISLAWYVDHFNRDRDEIVGTWLYPTPDFHLSGYRTTLEIRANGSFTKVQYGRSGCTTYDGNYSVNENGTITFQLSKRNHESPIFELFPDYKPEAETLDAWFRCRCAIDKSGHLLIDPGISPFAGGTGIKWETYMPCPAE